MHTPFKPNAKSKRLKFAAAVFSVAFTGCFNMTHSQSFTQAYAPTPWPLTFKAHDFAAHCYNTLRCAVIYDNYNFTRSDADRPSGPPPSTDYRDKWKNASYIGIRNFPSPAEVTWTSLDGSEHRELVDIGAIFKDERVLHHVDRNNIPDGWGHDIRPNVYVEVNDRTVSVLMRTHIATKDLRTPGNPDSNYRRDTIVAWSRTY